MARTPESSVAGHAAVGPGEAVVLEQDAAALGEAAAGAAEAGLEVLFARAREEETDVPFGVARRLLAPVLERLEEHERADVVSGQAALGAAVVNGGRYPGEFSAVHALYWLTARIAEHRPLALIVDDAQWADRATMRLCSYLAQRIEELPVALIVARRP